MERRENIHTSKTKQVRATAIPPNATMVKDAELMEAIKVSLSSYSFIGDVVQLRQSSFKDILYGDVINYFRVKSYFYPGLNMVKIMNLVYTIMPSIQFLDDVASLTKYVLTDKDRKILTEEYDNLCWIKAQGDPINMDRFLYIKNLLRI